MGRTQISTRERLSWGSSSAPQKKEVEPLREEEKVWG
jgi:hypothetical protein